MALSLTDYKPEYWDKACKALVSRDRILRRIIPQYSDEWLQPPLSDYASLARIVLGQQSSARAADKLWQKFIARFGNPPCPLKLHEMVSSGLVVPDVPKRKGRYIAGLAEYFVSHGAKLPCWRKLDNEEVIHKLSQIQGVGRWTAELFLIFNLHRPNVLPLEDASLNRAISLHYFSGEPVTRFDVREVAQAWGPWSTVAAWYLWRSLDPLAVRF